MWSSVEGSHTRTLTYTAAMFSHPTTRFLSAGNLLGSSTNPDCCESAYVASLRYTGHSRLGGDQVNVRPRASLSVTA
jgi:hypothetical protein